MDKNEGKQAPQSLLEILLAFVSLLSLCFQVVVVFVSGDPRSSLSCKFIVLFIALFTVFLS